MGNKVINTTSVKLGIYEQSSDAQLAGMIGDKKELEDGRIFRLCKAGAVALAAGYLVQAPVQDAYDDALVVNTAAAIGDSVIEITTTSGHAGYAENALAEGFLVVGQTAGKIGTFYKIKANDAMVTATTATITIYDKLTSTLVATTNKVSVCPNPYNGVVLDANSAPIIGTPIIAVTAAYYFWALSKGFGPAIATAATIAAGDYLLHTVGTVYTSASTAVDTERRIACAMNTSAASEALIVKYFIE